MYGQNVPGFDNREPILFVIVNLIVFAAWLIFWGIERQLTRPRLKKYAIYAQLAALFCFISGILPFWLDSLFHPIPGGQWMMTITGVIGILLWLATTVVSQNRWRQNQQSLRLIELKSLVKELFQNGKSVHEAYMVLNAPIDDIQYREIPFEEIEAIYDELECENQKKSDFWSDVRHN